MKVSVLADLTTSFQSCFQKVFSDASIDPLLRESKDAKHGDYQSNVAMSLAKKLKKNPRELAEEIIANLDLSNVCESVEVAGPGFINLKLSPNYLTLLAEKLIGHPERLGFEQTKEPIHHVIDYSGPNLAKEMHIGHLRSTIIGEVVARLLEFQGHTVERVNHVGDWGTQFGMLLENLYANHPDVLENPDGFEVKDLEVFYKEAKARFDQDESFADAARKRVVQLQAGDQEALKLWKIFLNESLRHCHNVYEKLDIEIEDKGESFYNQWLPEIVSELKGKDLAVVDDGAVCVFLDDFKNRDGEPLPVIVKKSDGGYNYATTDLAAIRYRVQESKAKRVIYVTDSRQSQHFQMVFQIARLAGWVGDDVGLTHLGFGMVLGPDRKPFKTREGTAVRLIDVIDESVAKSQKIAQGNPNLNEQKTAEVAEAVGISAIKYFDLSHNISSDYVFLWDHMLAMDGNTGPYMLYAYARIQSIGRKSEKTWDEILSSETEITLEHNSERALALKLIQFSEAMDHVTRELKPHLLTDYLYSLSRAFSSFYDKNSGVAILNAETPELMVSRLRLCALTGLVLKRGLTLLGLKLLEEM